MDEGGLRQTELAGIRAPAGHSGPGALSCWHPGQGAGGLSTDHPSSPFCTHQSANRVASEPYPPTHVFQDFFFYSLVYDPQQKTLLADKGEIRVGSRYQADITDLLKEGKCPPTRVEASGTLNSWGLWYSSHQAPPSGEEDGRDQARLETKVWEAHNPLVDKQIDQFLVVAR